MIRSFLLPLGLALVFTTARTAVAADSIAKNPENASFRNEIQLAIDRGLTWLKEQQKPEGYWSTSEHPALTSLPLIAFHREPSGKYRPAKAEFLTRGYDFIRSKAQSNGGIYDRGLSNYNTALALVALLNTGDPKDEALIAKAREFIIAQQAAGMATESLDGGIGYGPTGVSPKRQHPDLDNTLVSLEALRAYQSARPNAELKKDLNWKAAIEFISRTQNLPSHNPKASTEESNKGGFVYYPGFSNADPVDGPKTLRSYGSMSYAGFLSFIYADLKPEDPRVSAAKTWLQKNYTLEENPGMGRAGLYYYYHLMAKGLTAGGVDRIELPDGQKVTWRPALAKKLMDLQQSNGSWINDSARWMEKDPVLVTSYCLISLEIIYQGL